MNSELEHKLNNIINRNKIVSIFNKNVKGKKYKSKNKHDGSEGHWLENLFGLKHNSRNEPDIYGFELKKCSKKITFGDFSATEYLFSKKKEYILNTNGYKNIDITREDFINIFGDYKKDKSSWSGKCFPKYNEINDCGQVIKINKNNDILIKYYHSEDKRERKINFPEFIKKDNIVIAYWNRDELKNKINNKFDVNGFFICNKNKDGIYNSISLGEKFNFEKFIENFKEKNIILDSGMKNGNSRNYSQFRAGENFWKNLIKITF